MEKKKLSKMSKVLLITALVLILALVGITIYFVTSKLVDNKYKLVAVKSYKEFDIEFEDKIEIGFRNKKIYMRRIFTFENEDLATTFATLCDLAGEGGKCTVKDKQLIMEDEEVAKLLFSGVSNLIGLDEEEITEEFEKEYSKEEMEEILIIFEAIFTKSDYTIIDGKTEDVEEKFEMIINNQIIETSIKASEEIEALEARENLESKYNLVY